MRCQSIHDADNDTRIEELQSKRGNQSQCGGDKGSVTKQQGAVICTESITAHDTIEDVDQRSNTTISYNVALKGREFAELAQCSHARSDLGSDCATLL